VSAPPKERANNQYLELRIQSRELAHRMVQLEGWAREAYERGKWVRVGELHTQREEVQQQRSSLLREIWGYRR